MREPFDITKLADNGKRRGRTTGSCAAAAAKAAVELLVRGRTCSDVDVALPDERYTLSVPITNVRLLDETSARAEVLKDAGDDPDATHKATITVECRYNSHEEIRFFAGPGVGTVTQPGIRVAVGEPAINPVPRQMIRQAIVDSVGEEQGFDVIVGCVNGEVIAHKTFNPRLGIKGGISILGTTGIVEPLSLAAYIASIEVYVSVALGDNAPIIALLPGNLGLGFASKSLKLPRKRTVHISNFLGQSLQMVNDTLEETQCELPQLWVLGHPGKLAKVLDGNWDTHSKNSPMAVSAISAMATSLGCNEDYVRALAGANTVEDAIQQGLVTEYVADHSRLWASVQEEIARLCAVRAGNRVNQVLVKLYDMAGHEVVTNQSEVGK